MEEELQAEDLVPASAAVGKLCKIIASNDHLQVDIWRFLDYDLYVKFLGFL